MVKEADFMALASSTDSQSWKALDTLTDFDISTVETVDELLLIPYRVLMRFGLHEKYSINLEAWTAFMETVREKMADNLYHNLRHITDVVQTLGTYLALEKPMALLTDIDRLVLIITAIVHDLGHPGTNNLYEINRKTELALKYDNKAVLENFHIELSNALIFGDAEKSIALSMTLSEEERTAFKEGISDLILFTDMGQHFGLCGTLQECTKAWKNGDDSIATKDKMVYMKSLLHLADISNPFKKWSVCKYWSDLVFAEFYHQGDLEKAENLPVSMLCDRDTTFQDESSVNFIDFIVAPFLFATTAAFPELLPVCAILAENRQTWTNMTVKRLEETYAGDENKEKREEEVKKWVDKSAGFDQKFADVKVQCATPHPSPRSTE